MDYLVEVKDDFGGRMRYDYDCLGNPVLEEQVVGEGVIQRIRYGYNKNDWKIRKTEESRGNGDLRTAVTRYGYTNPDLYSQLLLEDFQGALESATTSGIKYGEIIVNGKWEFIFAPPRAKGQLPVIKHSVFSGWGE